MNCTSCGYTLTDGDRFCRRCGAPLSGTNSAPATNRNSLVPGECPACHRPAMVNRVFANIKCRYCAKISSPSVYIDTLAKSQAAAKTGFPSHFATAAPKANELASQQAAKEAAERAARQQAELAAKQAAEEQAAWYAQQAAEEAARHQAAWSAQQATEEARRQAAFAAQQAEEARRQQAESAARKAAEEEARLQEELAAKQQAELAAKQAAEQAAKLAAEQAEQAAQKAAELAAEQAAKQAVEQPGTQDAETAADQTENQDAEQIIEIPAQETLVFSDITVGSEIKFGMKEDQPITWKVLDAVNGAALIFSTDSVHTMAYHLPGGNITWKDSEIRKWLNNEFTEEYFSPDEQSRILISNVNNEDNPNYHTPGGEPTSDKVFLLSINDVNSFIPDKEARALGYTWWLRSPGSNQNNVAIVDSYGNVNMSGNIASNSFGKYGIRPAMWISVR